MLNWSQDELATNAQVARATIADFERRERDPVRNNMFSIISAFEARGVTFVDEGELGAGVRLKQPELEYINSVRMRGGDVIIPMKFRGQKFSAVVPREVIDDLDHTTYGTDEDRAKAVTAHFPKYLRIAERIVRRPGHELSKQLILTSDEMESYRLECVA
ncbi:MAG: helix-turn-helix transcriptional regulator [Sphingobium sp.]|nr:helix-turn-helix transcriptional regulator [Sphingobium sp.]